MADISTFPILPIVHDSALKSETGPFLTYTAYTAVKVGQAVCFQSSGADFTVIPSVGGAGTVPIGVAANDADAGAKVSIAMQGNVIEMANADDTTVIDAGDWVECNDNAVGGTINTIDFTASGTTVTMHYQTIGIALEDIAGGASGYVLIMPIPLVQGNAS